MKSLLEIDKIAYVRVENGKILSTKSRGKTKYYIPGGKREGNETDEETLIREIQEELNVSIISATISYFGTFKAQADSHKVGVVVKMTCYSAEFEGILEPCSEIEEIKWLSYTDREQVSEVDKLIFDFLKETGELI
ncbi:MAG: NUDIX domain-containing protein [Emticicia sp.]|nr:NUDIX domain-containing protein [Emticicia sp.]